MLPLNTRQDREFTDVEGIKLMPVQLLMKIMLKKLVC